MPDVYECDLHPRYRLRAIFCENIKIDCGDSDINDDFSENTCWMWFVGDPEHDEWFAHGISNVATEEAAEAIVPHINEEELVALLPYAGEPWENIEEAAEPFGIHQRALWHAMQGKPLRSLCQKTRAQIVKIRQIETMREQASWN